MSIALFEGQRQEMIAAIVIAQHIADEIGKTALNDRRRSLTLSGDQVRARTHCAGIARCTGKGGLRCASGPPLRNGCRSNVPRRKPAHGRGSCSAPNLRLRGSSKCGNG
jgi:hypothetical protein